MQRGSVGSLSAGIGADVGRQAVSSGVRAAWSVVQSQIKVVVAAAVST